MSDGWTQLELIEGAGQPAVHARQTDPVSSDLTVKSLGRDFGYNFRIFRAIMLLSERNENRSHDDGDSIAVIHDAAVTDDDIWTYMEKTYDHRFQRNVIARQRGIIRELGWIRRVDDITLFGAPRVAHIPTSAGIEAWYAYATSSHQVRSST